MIKSLWMVYILSILGWAVPAQATITIESLSGFSSVTNDEVNGYTVFGGFAGTCVAGDPQGVCDTCDGISLTPCSKNSVSANSIITIRYASTSTVTDISSVYVRVNSTDLHAFEIIPIISGNTVELRLRWGEICAAITAGNSSCSSDFSGSLGVGTKTSGDSATNDVATIKIRARVLGAGSAATYQNCPTDTTAVAADEGYCYFKPFRGDSKIYADELRTGGNYPSTGVAGINYRGPIFFYEEQLGGENDQATVARINNASAYVQLIDPNVDNRIDGLKNDIRYCFVMANEDETGVISRFTSLASITDSSELCGTPSAVVGLLDDKSCFIATAAFGSDMAAEVQSLREFRNHFLLTNKMGQGFVKIYYKYSPYFAEKISESEVSKAVIRVLLVGPLLFAKASMQFGFFFAFLFTVLILTSLIAGAGVLLQKILVSDISRRARD